MYHKTPSTTLRNVWTGYMDMVRSTVNTIKWSSIEETWIFSGLNNRNLHEKEAELKSEKDNFEF